MKTVDQIWDDDLLDRRDIADKLAKYIASRFAHPAPGGGSFTIAIEGPYGQGKSFFLERLGEQLAYSHPIAFVNAWADDTADDPLTSLFLAIEVGLAKKIKTQNSEKRNEIATKVKSVAKIAAKVAVRAAGARLLTKEGLEELEGAFETGVDDLFELKAEKHASAHLVERRTLIREFRDRLSELLDALEVDGLFKRPLVVIIDELDRCRPTYALRLLEEAKHFFDDTGAVFVYGMNLQALAATVRSIYGETFPAEHYLSRFVRRQVQLPITPLSRLIQFQFDANPSLAKKFVVPMISGDDRSTVVDWLARLFEMNQLHARDVEYVLENMFSFAAMWEYDIPIQAPYLGILSVRRYRQQRAEGLEYPPKSPDLEDIEGSSVYSRYEQISNMSMMNVGNELRTGIKYRSLLNAFVREYESRTIDVGEGFLDNTFRSHLAEYPARVTEIGDLLKLSPTQ